MKIGMNLPVMVPGLDRPTILEWCRRIDAGPFSSLCAGERITFPNPEVMVTLSAAAAVTERVRIAATVIVLPMHSPVLMAKQLATLDVLSAGRLTVGLGVGGREEDYRAVGAPFDNARLGRLERGVAIMRRAWAGENVVQGALRPVEPFPVQEGGPELLAGSLMPQSIRRAARWADGLTDFSFGPNPREVEMRFAAARAAWAEAGRPVPRLTTSCWFALGDGGRAQMDAYVGRYLNFMGPEGAQMIAPMCTTVSASGLKDVVKAIADLGADELMLVPTTADPEELDRVADLLG